jgi:type IV pilus assembly protein PilB
MRQERFGEYLVDKGVIHREALTGLLSTQRMVREKIGTIAVREGLLTEEELTESLAEYLGMPLFRDSVENVEKEIINVIPQQIALKANVLPVGTGENNELLVACSGALPKAMIQTISRLSKRQVKLVLTSAGKLKKMQNLFFSRQFDTRINLTGPVDVEDTGFIIELFEKIMVRAINHGASDVHVEPGQDELVLRFRLDGMLKKTEVLPLDLTGKLVSRIKVMAGMDISERRKPLDGAFSFVPQALDVKIDSVNVRVSTLPVIYGEKAVLRLLPPHDEVIHLDSLGMAPDTLERFKAHLKTPYGIILVTGPTGSGKSTTLYGALQMLRNETTNITTIEDPVELTVANVNQVQVSRGEKISFSSALRAILRQDPDIIMVGEIRDADTLRICLQAAVTGHVVLSTLHTNDAPSAFGRMIDMGAEPFLVAASVRAVLAQRLVRTVCPHCGQEQRITEPELKMLGMTEGGFGIKRGVGCAQCHMGYKGRTGVFELLSIDEDLNTRILTGSSAEELRRHAVTKKGFQTLRQDGINKVRAGLTTPEEIVRVTID